MWGHVFYTLEKTASSGGMTGRLAGMDFLPIVSLEFRVIISNFQTSLKSYHSVHLAWFLYSPSYLPPLNTYNIYYMSLFSNSLSAVSILFWPTSRLWALQEVEDVASIFLMSRDTETMHSSIHLSLNHLLNTHSLLGFNLGTRVTEMNKVWFLTLRALSLVSESAMQACNDHTLW